MGSSNKILKKVKEKRLHVVYAELNNLHYQGGISFNHNISTSMGQIVAGKDVYVKIIM